MRDDTSSLFLLNSMQLLGLNVASSMKLCEKRERWSRRCGKAVPLRPACPSPKLPNSCPPRSQISGRGQVGFGRYSSFLNSGICLLEDPTDLFYILTNTCITFEIYNIVYIHNTYCTPNAFRIILKSENRYWV